MAKVRLRAIRRVGRYAPGDHFEESSTDANILVLLGVAVVAEESAPAAGPAPRVKRAYRRRDMRAEG